MIYASFSGGRTVLVAAAFIATSCTFPDYIVPGETASTTSGNTGGAGTTSSVTSNSGSPTSTSSTGTSTASAGGGSSSSMSSTGSMSGPVCTDTCDKTNGATCSAACAPAATDPACDCDNDGEIVNTAACIAAHPSAQLDCYDCHAGAKHGIMTYSVVDRGDGSFDFNCSNLEEPQYDEMCGEGELTCAKAFRYQSTPGCGNNGDLYACTVPTLQTCKKAATFNVAPQACH